MDINELRDSLLEAALPDILFDGWTDHALRAASRSAGIANEMVLHAFPEGSRDLALYFPEWVDRRMAERYAAEDTAALSAGERVALALRLRFAVMDPYREAVHGWLAWLALPHHAVLAPRLLYRSIDQVWHTVGDRTTDFSFYTKRASLAAVYSSALLYWLGDESEDRIATRHYLDRALRVTAGVGRALAGPGDGPGTGVDARVGLAGSGRFGHLLDLMPTPARMVRLIRRRASGAG